MIGVPLPMDLVRAGAQAITFDADGAAVFARAIITTDTHPKSAAAEVEIGGKTVRIGGSAKGAGMIHPNMATLLAFVVVSGNLARIMLHDVGVQLRFPDYLRAGEPAHLSIALVNRKLLVPSCSISVEALPQRVGAPAPPRRKGLFRFRDRIKELPLAHFIVVPPGSTVKQVVEHTFELRGRGERDELSRALEADEIDEFSELGWGERAHLPHELRSLEHVAKQAAGRRGFVANELRHGNLRPLLCVRGTERTRLQKLLSFV